MYWTPQIFSYQAPYPATSYEYYTEFLCLKRYDYRTAASEGENSNLIGLLFIQWRQQGLRLLSEGKWGGRKVMVESRERRWGQKVRGLLGPLCHSPAVRICSSSSLSAGCTAARWCLLVLGSWPHAGSAGHIRSLPGGRRRCRLDTWP